MKTISGVKIFKYNCSPKTRTGAYGDINGVGQGYGTTLFLKRMGSGRLTGKIMISDKPLSGAMKFIKGEPRECVFDNWYYFQDDEGFNYRGISLDREITNKKVIYIIVSPTKRKTNGYIGG